MRRFGKVALSALVLLGCVVACSTDDFINRDDLLGLDDGAGAGAKQVLKVDGSAEARLTLKTGASLTIPKGAVDRNLEIGIERPEDEVAVEFVKALPAIKSAASAPYVLTPHGTKFMGRVTLELPVVSKHQDRALVAAYLEDEDDRDWKLLDVPTVTNGKAAIGLGHFSVVILLEAASAGLGQVPDGGTSPAADAGAALDAGSSTASDAALGIEPWVDAGVAEDAGETAYDTGTSSDGGVAWADSGTVSPDAGVPYDAGVPFDAGVYDAGVPYDAGPYDAGVPFDAGPYDAGVYDAGPYDSGPYDTGVPPLDAGEADSAAVGPDASF